jgi:hypothetical protein
LVKEASLRLGVEIVMEMGVENRACIYRPLGGAVRIRYLVLLESRNNESAQAPKHMLSTEMNMSQA